MKRKTNVWRAVAALVCVFALAVVSGCSSASSGDDESDTLVLGVPLGLTGPIAEQAEQMRNGYELYLSENDGKVGGVPVDLRFEDTQSDPNMVVQKARKLIKNDQVDAMIGGALAFESLAIRDQVDAAKMAYVSPQSSADDLTQRKGSPLVGRTNPTSSQPTMPFGEYAYDKLGYKRIALVAQDYAYGWEAGGGFQYGFEKSGGEIVKKIWVPLEASDWGPFVRQIPKDVDAVWALPVGAGVPRFIKAYDEFGLNGKIPLIGGPDLADEDALQAVGTAAVGIVHSHTYNPTNPETEKFASAYEAKYGNIPSYWGESTYGQLEWFAEVIDAYREENDASVSDTISWIKDEPEEFIAKFQEVDADLPRGPSKMDKYNNPDLNVYVVEVNEKGGKPVRETVETFPMVSQFWNVPPEEFLEQPVFSRSFPE
jgi:branched-chain amino acid transport system substrate-binding protein